MNILIVDDNKAMRCTIREFISDLTESIYECDDGRKAFDFYAEHLPDWVFMDIQMKDLDGISATKQIIGAFPRAKIAIVTDYDDEDLREAALAAGASKYFVKENLIDLRGIFAQW